VRPYCLLVLLTIPLLSQAQDDCPYDLSGDGFIGPEDYLLMLGTFGDPGDPDTDFNGNGIEDFEDIRIFNRHEGLTCPITEVQESDDLFVELYLQAIHTFEDSLMGSPVLPNSPDTIPAGAVTYQLILSTNQSNVAVSAVWGDANHPLNVVAWDGLFESYWMGNAMPPFAGNVSNTLLYPIYPTMAHASWWALDLDPYQEESSIQALIDPNLDFNAHFYNGDLVLDAEIGNGWYRYLNDDDPLPTSGNEKLLGQFTTLGNIGQLWIRLNVELRVFNGPGIEDDTYFVATGLCAEAGVADLCFPLPPLCPDGVDINGDGLVSTSDLLLLLTDFGNVTDAPTDIDDNGVVNINDVLGLLGAFGMVCG